MAIKRITLSVPEDVARRIKRAAGAKPVSVWVTDAIEKRLTDAALEAEWQNFCQSNPSTRAEVRRAEGIVRRLKSGKRRNRAA